MKFILKLCYLIIFLLLQACNKDSIVVIRNTSLGLEWNQSQTVDMGTVGVGSVTSQLFTLTNKSENTATNCQPVELSDLTEFTVVSPPCSPTMAPNSTCDVRVEASPQSAGFKNLSLRIKCDLADASSAPVASAKVEAVVINISWTPTSVRNYGSVVIGEYAGLTYNYTLTNAGTHDVTGCRDVTLSNTTDFDISSNTCTNPILAPLETCVVAVRAKPMSGGVKSTSIIRTCAVVGPIATQTSKTKVTGVSF